MPILLVSLAEEYFKAAHELAPAAALSMSNNEVEAYERLIATGLACLDTALKNVRLPPRLEANIRLRYAGVLFEETENSMEAETALTKGIALCERVWIFPLRLWHIQELIWFPEPLLRPQVRYAIFVGTVHGDEEPKSVHEDFGWLHFRCTGVSIW